MFENYGIIKKKSYLRMQRPHIYDIIHISHGFEGDIPQYQPRGDTKALARYVT
mgnify:CR=1 FL=1